MEQRLQQQLFRVLSERGIAKTFQRLFKLRVAGVRFSRQVAILPCLLLLASATIARGQYREQRPEPVFAEPDRSVRQRLDMAQELLDGERYSEAVQVLTSVLSATEDFLILPDKTKTGGDETGRDEMGAIALGWRKSFRGEARRMIGELPPEAHRAYELQYGETARRRLVEALESVDVDAVAQVPRDFPHTRASQEALMFLAYDHMNRGRFLAAALCFEQISMATGSDEFDPMLSVMLWTCWSRVGKPTKALAVAEDLRERSPQAELEIDGDRYSVFADDGVNDRLIEALDKQRPETSFPAVEWKMVGGNATRTAASSGGRPLLLRPRWRQRISSHAGTNELIAAARAEYTDQVQAAVPAAYPLALRDLIIMRSPHRLVAVDFETGKRLWEIDQLSRKKADDAEDATGMELPTEDEVALRQRVWQDRTLGTLSSDGSTVFAIEDLPVPPKVDLEDEEMRGFRGEPNEPAPARNELTAYDIAHSEGKRLWTVGGPQGIEPRLEEAFFLGPPLPLDGSIYTIVELAGEIRLVVLGSDGRIQWTQQLAVPASSDAYNTDRRRTGLSPSAAENILVCPTGVGAVVGVDLTTRDLLWGHSYERRGMPVSWGGGRRNFGRPVPEPQNFGSLTIGSASVDDGVTIVEGHVLVNPSDSPTLYCLDLATGKLHWTDKRQADHPNLYVGAVYSDQVIVVSTNAIASIDLLSGRRHDFTGVDFEQDLAPSGRGFCVADRYYLPVAGRNGGELLIFDIEEQQLVERVALGDGSIPGNLICYRGQIASLGTEYLELYYDLAALKLQIADQLEQSPDDPWALTTDAETSVEVGDHEAAIPKLRQARSEFARLAKQVSREDPLKDRIEAGQVVARRLLFESLLSRLRLDYPANQPMVAELQPLIAGHAERISYLQVIAEGREQLDERSAALDAYLDLIAESRRNNALVRLSPGYSVRHSNWIQARLRALYPRLDDATKEKYDATLEQDIASLAGANTPAKLYELLRYHDGHPAAIRIRERILDQFSDRLGLSEQVALLTTLSRQGPPETRGRATAQLARLYEQAFQSSEAAVYYGRLLREWSDIVVFEGQTGSALVEALPVEQKVRRQLEGQSPWPTGAVSYDRVGQSGVRNTIPIRILSRGEAHSENLFMEFVPQQQEIVVRNGQGETVWEITVPLSEGNNLSLSDPSARLVENRMFLSIGNELVALDRFRQDTAEGAVLWRTGHSRQSFDPYAQYRQNMMFANVRVAPGPWSDSGNRQRRRSEKPYDALGPVNQGGIVQARGRDLISLDVATGEPLWVRHNFLAKGRSNQVQLFGDEEVLVVAFRDDRARPDNAFTEGAGSRATILRSMDGETLVESAPIPSPSRRWTTRGRMILEWRTTDEGQVQLVLFDPWRQSDVWAHEIAPSAKGSLVGDDQVAIMERGGRFRVIDLGSGELHFEQRLAKEPQLRGLHVTRDQDRYVVFVNQRTEEPADNVFRGVQAGRIAQFSGRIYTFDRESGEALWATPATIENQAYSVDQPAELPVLVFCRLKPKAKAEFTFLDKQTGALAGPPVSVGLSRNRYGRISHFNGETELAGMRVRAEPGKKTIHVSATVQGNRNFALDVKFTSGPRPPRPRVQTIQSEKSGAVMGFLDEGLRAIGDLGNALGGGRNKAQGKGAAKDDKGQR